jgi:4-methylaminobutanoate oxidase (formaldehyde-forming)
MSDRARVVIIGGGIAGCSIAYHLARHGITDVILLDKGELTSGTTWHAAGMVTHFHTSPTIMRMRKYSIELYRSLQAGPDAARHWHEVGSLRVASSPEQLAFLQRQVGMARAIGLDVGIISAAEARRIFPLMSPDRLYGAMYLPGDGWIEPSGATMELAARARALGVTIRTGTRVTAIERSPRGEVTGVRIERSEPRERAGEARVPAIEDRSEPPERAGEARAPAIQNRSEPRERAGEARAPAIRQPGEARAPAIQNIEAETVIIAAGMWAAQLAATVGVRVPITPLVHQHLATRPIPGHALPRDTPCLRDPENLVYMREEVGGFLIGGFETEPVAWSVGGVPWDFTQQLLPSDWDLFQPILEGAIRRVPVLAQAETAHLVNGPEGITPDSRPLLGPVPGVPGLWMAAGLSHTGFGAGGAIGQIMTEWIAHGEPPYDVTEMNVRRFGPVYDDPAYAAERARESYRYYYSLRYPHDENEWARGRRLSPLDAESEKLGAVFGEKNGWERVTYHEPGTTGRRAGADQRRWGWRRPAFFDLVGEEHRAVRERVAIFDMTSFGKLDVAGPGALALLQRLADNDVDRPPGSVVYTQFLNPRGGIESDLTIVRMDHDRFRVVCGSAFVPSDLGWIRMHMPEDGSVEVREVTDAWACIGLWGPEARQVLEETSHTDLSNAAFPYMTARAIDVAGVAAWAQRVTYVGELGWEIYVAPEHAPRAWRSLLDAGAEHGIRPAGYKALDSLRLEKGYRYWSTDITPAEHPFEAGLGFCVRPGKGDFIGRDALLRLKAAGVTRKLCTVVLTEGGNDVVLYGGEPVYADSDVVGRLRSGGWGYTVGQNIGYVYLPLALAPPGTGLQVEVLGHRFATKVAADVLYDPQGMRIRA